MVDALVADLRDRGVQLKTGTAVTALRHARDRYELETADGTIVADGVVLAAPGYVAARLLVDDAPAAAAELGSIPHSSVSLVTLAWPSDAISGLPQGSGFLVPRCEGRIVTGCSFLSSKWPDSASAGEVVVRASTGRYGDERPSSMSDEELVDAVLVELRELIGASVPPLASLVRRWPRAFPQYLPGHLRKIERARAALSELPALELAGPSLGGIGDPGMLDNWRASCGGGSRSTEPMKRTGGGRAMAGPTRRGRSRGAFAAAVRVVAPGLFRSGTPRLGLEGQLDRRPGGSRLSRGCRAVRDRPRLGGQVHVSRLWRAHRPSFGDVRRRLRARSTRTGPGAGAGGTADARGMGARALALRRRATRWDRSRAGERPPGRYRTHRRHGPFGGCYLPRRRRARRPRRHLAPRTPEVWRCARSGTDRVLRELGRRGRARHLGRFRP